MAEPYELLLGHLDRAVREFDRDASATACTELLAWAWKGDVSEQAAESVAKAVREHRCWHALAAITSALMARGLTHSWVRSAFVQSAIDSGELGLARGFLRHLLQQHPEDSELLGLDARVSKQAFVQAVESGASSESIQQLLDDAFSRYVSVYAKTEKPWHGINAVALAMRAAEDGLKVSPQFDARAAAGEIMRTARKRLLGPMQDPWDFALVLECAIALDQISEALTAAAVFASAPGIGSFAYASNLRQLREIWRLDEGDPIKRAITGLLEAKIISLHGGASIALRTDVTAPPTGTEARTQIERALKNVAPSFKDALKPPNDEAGWGLERLFEGRFVELDNLRRGLACADAVGWLANRNSGRRIGTGFLVQAEQLDPRLGNAPILVTNAHVLASAGAPLTPGNALVGFESGARAGTKFEISELLWSSPPREFDVAIARLSGAPQGGLAALAPQLPDRETRAYLYVIGHPKGSALSFSLMDNLLVDYDEQYLHYRCATEPGSSGSPVLDLDWQLVGLHHGGGERSRKLHGKSGTYAVNEGIRFDAICKAFRASWTPRVDR